MEGKTREDLVNEIIDLGLKIDRARKKMKEARVFAGDNLPAQSGLTMIIKLENAMEELK